MGMAYMDEDGSMGGQGSLRAPLGLAVIDPLGVTYVGTHGCHLSGYIGLNRVGDRKGKALLFQHAHLNSWTAGSRVVASCS